MAYQLSCQLQDHKSDVRGVCCLPSTDSHPSDRIVTASRDKTAKLWRRNEEGRYDVQTTFEGHTKFVNVVCAVPATPDHPEGLIATGCNDCKIRIFKPDSPEPLHTLSGHEMTVCALVAGNHGTLVSGSWDSTAMIWAGYQRVLVLRGHTGAVWAVALLPDRGLQITASADHTIRLWHAGSLQRTLTEHTDCVRSLAVLSADEFLSASNDGTLRQWSVTGNCLRVFHGHEAFIYSVCLIGQSDQFVSSGEDWSLRVWQGEGLKQTIILPAESVWSVCCLPNGDIVCGSSDGFARVFSERSDGIAAQSEIEEFHQHVEAMRLEAKTGGRVGDLDMSNVRGEDMLRFPGQHDGEHKLIREGNSIFAYQWDGKEEKWIKLGEVTNAIDNKKRGQLIGNKEYDYVFDIDVQEGKSPLKLGYNKGQDPWMVANQFIQDNMLSPQFLDQVTNFIIQNTGGQAAAPVVSTEFHDPLTGGGRYVPGSGGSSSAAGATDPFTGGGRYVPGSGSAGGFPQAAAGGADPFTGGSRHVPAGAPGAAAQTAADLVGASVPNRFFPKEGVVTFDTANTDGLLRKLTEFNDQVPQDCRLDKEKMTELKAIVPTMATGGIVSGLQDVMLLLARWPAEKMFPVLDLLRLVIRYSCDSVCMGAPGSKVLGNLLQFSRSDITGNNCLLSLRSICNMCVGDSGAQLIDSMRHDVLDVACHAVREAAKNHQVAACTILLNLSILYRPFRDLEKSTALLTALAKVLEHRSVDDNALFRALVAVGTVVFGADDALAVADSLNMRSLVKGCTSSATEKVRECAEVLLSTLPQ